MERMAPASRGGSGRAWLRVVTGVVGIAVLVWVFNVMPEFVGTTWHDVGELLTSLDPLAVTEITVLWVGTLAAQTLVQAAALPGLRRRDALSLNLGSSAVASAVPLGGPVSLGLIWAMLRSWGFDRHAFTSYTLVTTVVTTVARLLAPMAAALVLVRGTGLPREANQFTAWAAVALVGTLAVTALLGAPPLRRRLANAPGHRRLGRLAREVDTAIGRSIVLIRDRWRGLIGGSIAVIVLQYLLLMACFAATDAGVGWRLGLVAFGAGRLLSIVPVTPGGLGVTEAGVGALLVAVGTDPSATIAALLLFSLFVVVAEIPLGGAAVLVWRLQRHAPVRNVPDAGPADAGPEAGADAGPADAGPSDAGVDAGPEAGADAEPAEARADTSVESAPTDDEAVREG